MRVLLPLNHRRKKPLTAAEQHLLSLENESPTDSVWTKRDTGEEDEELFHEDEEAQEPGIGSLPLEAFADPQHRNQRPHTTSSYSEGLLEEKKPAAQAFVAEREEPEPELPRKRAPATADTTAASPETLFSASSSSCLSANPAVKRPRIADYNSSSSSSSNQSHNDRSSDSSSNDSKLPAKPKMVAPKRTPTPDGQADGRSAWEENEPTQYIHNNNNNNNHQSYYRNHPNNLHNRHLSPTTTANNNHRAMAEISARAKNYNDPAMVDADGRTTEEEEFAAALKTIGLEIVPQEGDGNCLFRAVSLQVYGDASMHAQVREQCLNFMAVNEEHFGQFLTEEEPFESYIARKRQVGVHGNNPEIQAISELFNRPVQIYAPHSGAKPLNIFHKEYKTADEPIRLSYHDNNHYNAIVDPRKPTAGLGLGLPGLQPGLADKLQVAAATAESDLQSDLDQALKESQKDHSKYNDDQLQKALKESSFAMDGVHQDKALALSDIDATNDELMQAVLWEDQGRKQRARRRTSPQTTPAATAASPSLVASSHAPPAVAAAAAASPPSPEHPSAAAAPSVAAAAAASSTDPPESSLSPYDYPNSVQELVMNGFPLKRAVHAYELVGDNFDEMIAFLLQNDSRF